MHEVIGHALGQGRRAAERQSAGGAQGAVLGARGGARRSRRAVFPSRSEARRARACSTRPTRPRSSAPSTRATRATRWCSCGACAKGTQIEEDHMRNRQMIVHWLMANTKADRSADARRQDVLRDDRPSGVSRRRRPTARRSPADQGAKGTTTAARAAVRDLRRALRSRSCATKWSRASSGCTCRPTPASCMPTLEPVQGHADGRSPTSKISYPLRSDGADAGVFGRDAAASASSVPWSAGPFSSRMPAEPRCQPAAPVPFRARVRSGRTAASISRESNPTRAGFTIRRHLLAPLARRARR